MQPVARIFKNHSAKSVSFAEGVTKRGLWENAGFCGAWMLDPSVWGSWCWAPRATGKRGDEPYIWGSMGVTLETYIGKSSILFLQFWQQTGVDLQWHEHHKSRWHHNHASIARLGSTSITFLHIKSRKQSIVVAGWLYNTSRSAFCQIQTLLSGCFSPRSNDNSPLLDPNFRPWLVQSLLPQALDALLEGRWDEVTKTLEQCGKTGPKLRLLLCVNFCP